MIRCRNALLALACIGLAGVARAAVPPPIVVDGQPFFTAVGPHAEVLRDTVGDLTIREVMSGEGAARFAPAGDKVPAFGYDTTPVWVRFTVESCSQRDETVLLELGMSRLSSLQWFVTDGAEVSEVTASWAANPAPGGRTDLRFPAMALMVPAGEARTVYARAQSDTSVWLPFVLGTPLEFESHGARRDFWDFAHAGFCAALVLLSLGLWWVSGRQGFFLSVALAMACGIVYFTLYNGLYSWVGGPWPRWMERPGILVSALLFSVMFMKFTVDYLGWARLSRAEKAVIAASYGITGLMILLCVILPYTTAVRLAHPVHALCLFAAGGVAVSQAVVRRGRGMGLFVLAWGVFLAGTLLFYLQLNGLVPLAAVSPYGGLRIVYSSVFLLFLLAGASSYRALWEMETKVVRLQRAETEARLEALRYQLNPHFLFNTLSSISELALEAPARVPGLVGRLAAFLRLRLKPEPSPFIPLARELESVRAYLGIEEMRFEDRLRVHYDIEPGADSCPVPEMVLMPLVENAVKYGFRTSGILEIRISARVRDGRLVVRVENSGRLDHGARRGAGVGTENLRTRLRLRHGDAARFTLSESGGFVVAETILPVPEEGS